MSAAISNLPTFTLIFLTIPNGVYLAPDTPIIWILVELSISFPTESRNDLVMTRPTAPVSIITLIFFQRLQLRHNRNLVEFLRSRIRQHFDRNEDSRGFAYRSRYGSPIPSYSSNVYSNHGPCFVGSVCIEVIFRSVFAI